MSLTERQIEAAEHWKWLAQEGPLPSVRDIAGPVAQAFNALAHLGERVEPLTWLSEFGGDRADEAAREAFALRDLLHQIALAVELGAARCVPSIAEDMVGSAARLVASAIGRMSHLDAWAMMADMDDLVYGPGAT